MERTAAAEVEARLAPLVAGERGGWQAGRRRTLDARQVVHVVVERLQPLVPSVEQYLVEAAFLGFAGVDRNAHVHGRLNLGRHDRKHRETAGGMEAAHRHRQAGGEEMAREVDGTRELIGLHTDQADQRLAAGPLDIGHDLVRADAGVGFVKRLDENIDVRPQNLTLQAIFPKAIEGRERIGRNVGLEPRDGIAVVVVVRRLDQHQVKGCSLLCTAHCGLLQVKSARGPKLSIPPLYGIHTISLTLR